MYENPHLALEPKVALPVLLVRTRFAVHFARPIPSVWLTSAAAKECACPSADRILTVPVARFALWEAAKLVAELIQIAR